MNAKILIAFAAGMVLASGLAYVALKPASPEKSAVSMQQAPLIAQTKVPLPAVPDDAAPPVAPAAASPRQAVKPSPAPAAPRALRQPVNRERPVNDAQPASPEPPSAAPAAPPVAPAPPEPPKEVVHEAPPAPVQPHSVTVAAGTMIAVRLGETLSTKNNQPGDTFFATLSQPLVVDGLVIAERGARAEGRIVEVERAGKVKGLSHLTVELTKLTTSDGQHVRVRTASFNQQGKSSRKTDAAKVGIGAALGAAIGAIAGGGKGAGIGAGVGGAAGAGDVLLTRGDDAVIPVETGLSFRLQEPVTVTERLR